MTTTEIARLKFPELRDDQKWVLDNACERQDVPDSVKESYTEQGLYRPMRYRHGTHFLDVCKTEDTYSGDNVIATDFPPQVWQQVITKAVESFRNDAEMKLEFIVAKAQTDLKVLKKITASDLLRQKPSKPNYYPMFDRG
jgi:tellurite resistance-related uncharacterized protein